MRIHHTNLEHMFDLAGFATTGGFGYSELGTQLICAQMRGLAFIEKEINRTDRVGNGAGPAFGIPAHQGGWSLTGQGGGHHAANLGIFFVQLFTAKCICDTPPPFRAGECQPSNFAN